MSGFNSQSTPQTNAEYETAFRQILVEIDCMNEKMAHNRKDIERLKNEADLLKVETRAILAAMGLLSEPCRKMPMSLPNRTETIPCP